MRCLDQRAARLAFVQLAAGHQLEEAGGGLEQRGVALARVAVSDAVAFVGSAASP